MGAWGDEKYIHIPFTILRRRDLSDKAKMLYGLVQGFWEGTFIASNAWIARTFGTSPRTVQRALEELIKKGLVSRTIVVENGKTKGRILKIK